MLEVKAEGEEQSNIFSAVRFILIGFDPVSEQNVGLKLVNGGAVDVCHYGPACTHVIVDNLVSDDPICVAARRDGKVLVTGLWVDHSFSEGVAVDPTSIMYKPLKGRNGIPGAKTLLVCLTGYQRQDRDDIMTMVRLMGANFSKPLVANKVTHLICYKFEGEKYELARKMKTIKLVNHRWLEDCLKAWEILPEADYDKSGYELDMMEAEAKDSEEEDAAQEPIPKQSEEIDIVVSPSVTTIRARVSPQSTKNLSTHLQFSSASKAFPNVRDKDIAVSANREEILSVKRLNVADCNQDPLDLQDVSYDQPYVKTPISAKVGSNLAANSDGTKSSSKSYSRNTVSRNTIPVFKREFKSLSSFSKVDVDKFNTSDGFDRSSKLDVDKYNTSDGVDRSRVGTETGPARSSPKEDATLYGKRKMDTSFRISKSPKINSDAKASNSGTPSACNSGVDKNVSSSFQCTSPAHKANASFSPKNSSTDNLTKETKYDLDPKSLFKSVSELKEPRPASIEALNMGPAFEHGLDNIMGKSENFTTEAFTPQRQRNDEQVASPKAKISGLDKSCSPTSDSFKGKDDNSLGKPVRKKTIAKRTWNSGCRPKVALRKAKNQKGSIYLNDAESSPVDKHHDCENPKILPSNFNVDKTMVTETNIVEPLEKEHVDKLGDMDDETEAPEDKEEDEVQAADREEKAEETDKVTFAVEDRSESTVPSPIKADDKPEDLHYVDENGEKSKNVPSGGKNGLNQSAINKDSEFEKPTKSLGKRKSLPSFSGKRKLKEKVITEESEINKFNWKMGLNEKESSPSPRTKAEETPSLEQIEKPKVVAKGKSPVVNRKSVPLVSEKIKSKEGESREESRNKKSNQMMVQSKKKNCPVPIMKAKRVPPLKEAKGSTKVEKENRPLGISDPNVGQRIAKAASNFEKARAKTGSKAGVTGQSSIQGTLDMQSEPTCFLLTGHKLQRKEFQQVIKRLKGRVCRDSHKWSYQATHFINPEPLRRTEKFFAAAASGRWILKTDYLAACNQAGEFLPEEPYEWHKKCLSEDGAINLEAPRKWRLLRERTGHGALYGMRVIIYGECIAPTLETLKRVIKAGDGNTLATSPPYTRALNSGVDYAIVSSGMPRVDMWVQEFLRYEIPCVVADYLVEYVCKPGYPLDKHVLYNTQAWAEKSFAKLQNMAEEVVLENETSEDEMSDNICCEICGSSGREEVMLICGDESGSFGCGVGTHIDCCNPPLESVPDDDWFCFKCSESKISKGRSKGTKKGRSLSKAN